ncbi:MAG: Uma2 family endonuclease [Candidatus Eremiobacteraeota bacterium]|nr:Uma2 family endonuclease [Candidatus Eremiobacteraeota bacterium]
MTDVLPTEFEQQRAEILDEMMRELYDALPHEYKAELVDGELHLMSPSGELPGRAASNILISLRHYERGAGGRAYGDNVGFRVDLPGRGSFSPDAGYYTGSSRGMGWIYDAPDFAVEVRSEGDYGPRMEGKMARKREDYFTAGTKVVWDVDLLGQETIRVYRADRPDTPDVFRRGELADAEPAVPGWRFAVDELFD